jgi:hypothetical protein
MRKILIALAISMLAILGIAGPASAGTHAEHLECSNPSNGYTVTADIDYTPSAVTGHPGHWDVIIDSVIVHTTPNFNMDRWWLHIEIAPNQWFAVARYGGTGNPQNTVATDWVIFGPRGAPINDDSQSPAWRMYADGVGAGSATYSCTDYGGVF